MLLRVRIGLLALAVAATLPAQERRSPIDVEHYVITAEINPAAQSISAVVEVRFQPYAAQPDRIRNPARAVDDELPAHQVENVLIGRQRHALSVLEEDPGPRGAVLQDRQP